MEGRPGRSLVTLALIREEFLLRDLLASTPEVKELSMQERWDSQGNLWQM